MSHQEDVSQHCACLDHSDFQLRAICATREGHREKITQEREGLGRRTSSDTHIQ